MRIAVFDYGAGNLHSLAKALRGEGRAVRLEADPRAATDADLLVLPGVGAFGRAAAALKPGLASMRAALRDGLPCLGVCLGMQLLFEASEEGAGEGLGVLAGPVTRLRTPRRPQIGWNTVDDATDGMFARAGLTTAYYANGFACRPADPAVVIAWSTHDGDRFPAAVRAGRTLGVQFHPEKSSRPGLAFVHDFLASLAAPGAPGS